MEKIIVWYLDDNNDTRLQMLEKPPGYLIQTFLYEFSHKPGVSTIIEAQTVSAIHAISERAWTEGFDVDTTVLPE